MSVDVSAALAGNPADVVVSDLRASRLQSGWGRSGNAFGREMLPAPDAAPRLLGRYAPILGGAMTVRALSPFPAAPSRSGNPVE